MTVRPLTVERAVLDPANLGDLARLRMQVFREWPYLYEGSPEYEAEYLAEFLSDPAAVVVIAKDGEQTIGMATASPLTGQGAGMVEALGRFGLDAGTTFYFGESVLLPEYRSRGVGHAFFDHREGAARSAGATHSVFCAVLRDQGHPLRPGDGRNLEPFWRGRGYARADGATISMDWLESGEGSPSAHTMQFWWRNL